MLSCEESPNGHSSIEFHTITQTNLNHNSNDIQIAETFNARPINNNSLDVEIHGLFIFMLDCKLLILKFAFIVIIYIIYCYIICYIML